MPTQTVRAPRRRDPKDIILRAAYIVLFAIAGVTCLTGILLLRSGLRIAPLASHAASTTSVVREPALLASPAAAYQGEGLLVTMPGAPIVREVAPEPPAGASLPKTESR
jgi:hypothetical protein